MQASLQEYTRFVERPIKRSQPTTPDRRMNLIRHTLILWDITASTLVLGAFINLIHQGARHLAQWYTTQEAKSTGARELPDCSVRL